MPRALDQGVRRIVYTSSISVHMPPAETTITLESPLAEPLSPYAVSRLINGFRAILAAVETRMMLVPAGGTTVIDVRDLARLLTRIIDHDVVVPRVLAAGPFLGWDEWVEALEAAVGHASVKQPITREEILLLAKQLTDAAAATGEAPALTEEAATFTDTIAYLREIGRLPGPG